MRHQGDRRCQVSHVAVSLAIAFAAGQARAENPDSSDCAMDWSPLVWSLYQTQAFETGYDGTGVTVAPFESGWPRNWEEYLPPGSIDLLYAAGFGSHGSGNENSISSSADQQGDIWYGWDNDHAIFVSSAIVGYRGSAELLQLFGQGPCIAGVAVGAKILPIRVTTAGLAGAFHYLADLTRAGAFPGGIVINYSYNIFVQADSSPNPGVVALSAEDYEWFTEDVTAAIDDAIDAGVIIVAGAGNSGPFEDSVYFPSNLSQVISTGAAGFP